MADASASFEMVKRRKQKLLLESEGQWGVHSLLETQTTIYKWMFGETTISYVKIWNYAIETTIYKWLFGVPGLKVA